MARWFGGREDLKNPHAAALWDSRVYGVVVVGRKDLKNPHAAAMWDFRVYRVVVVGRKDLKDPHAAAMWDSRESGLCSRDLRLRDHGEHDAGRSRGGTVNTLRGLDKIGGPRLIDAFYEPLWIPVNQRKPG